VGDLVHGEGADLHSVLEVEHDQVVLDLSQVWGGTLLYLSSELVDLKIKDLLRRPKELLHRLAQL